MTSPVETLRTCHLVLTQDHGPQVIRWTRSVDHRLKDAEDDAKPVQIEAGALGHNLPVHAQIVSPQHGIFVGSAGQLQQVFASEAFAPAKSLAAVPGIRHMKGKAQIRWIHFACDHREFVTANGCLSESVLLGPMVVSCSSRLLCGEKISCVLKPTKRIRLLSQEPSQSVERLSYTKANRKSF